MSKFKLRAVPIWQVLGGFPGTHGVFDSIWTSGNMPYCVLWQGDMSDETVREALYSTRKMMLESIMNIFPGCRCSDDNELYEKLITCPSFIYIEKEVEVADQGALRCAFEKVFSGSSWHQADSDKSKRVFECLTLGLRVDMAEFAAESEHQTALYNAMSNIMYSLGYEVPNDKRALTAKKQKIDNRLNKG